MTIMFPSKLILSTILIFLICCGCTSGSDQQHIDGDEEAADTDMENGAEDGDLEVEADEDGDDDTDIYSWFSLDWVDPLIGTGGYGFWGGGNGTPGATRPFGMVKPSPDTQGTTETPDPLHHAGYYYHDDWIAGFSQTHMHGVGITSYGHILMLPRLGTALKGFSDQDYRTRFDKSSETVSPAYYAVTLENGIRVELTASDRVAWHRYSFPTESDDPRCVLIDIAHALPNNIITDARIDLAPEKGRFTATLLQLGGFSFDIGGLTMYAYGAFPPNPDYIATWNSSGLEENRLSVEGSMTLGALICYENRDILELQVGMSFASANGANANLENETTNATFDSVLAEGQDQWRRLLSRIRIDSDNDDIRRQFYSALYRTLLMPTLMSDADETYLGFDGQLHEIATGRYYSDFSLWDTYRTQHPLLTIVYPEYQLEMVHSLLSMARQGGYFPKWAFANGETNIMVGTPADIVMADSFLKGLVFPFDEALDFSMLTVRAPTEPGSRFLGRESFSEHLDIGYIPADVEGGSVSKTQEYAVADQALCEMATRLGRTEYAELVCQTRFNHRNLWDEEHAFFLPLNEDGSSAWPDFSPESIPPNVLDGKNSAFTEGNPWHYLFFAPHDASSLIEMNGGSESFNERLSNFFELSQDEFESLPDDPEVIGGNRLYYWHGNEPSLHTAYLFSSAGRPDLACQTVRWVMDTHYNSTPDGLPGNDDVGTLSAWLVFSMLGFYPNPGTDDYWLACPRVRRAEIQLADGLLVIRVEGPLDGNVIPIEYRFDGEVLSQPTLTWSMIRNGGELIVIMQEKP
jgi:predicted alpha-1,2-mannosidase